MKKLLILFAVLAPTVALLYFGLTRDPRELPSALLKKTAPAFRLKTVQGEEVSLSSLKGSPVVLNFWSTWCGPCAAEHEVIRKVQAAYKNSGVRFFSILYEDTVDNARAFIRERGEAAPILIDPGLRTAIDYGVAGVPETFFIDRDGVVIYKHAGMLTPDLLSEEIGILIGGKTS